MRSTILLYNPHSTSRGKQRLPLSLMAISAMIAADYDIEFIDGNLIDDPAAHIIERAKATGAKLLAVTVMPGPQIRQAVPVCKSIKKALPDLNILWGGYFPSNHTDVVLESGFVDYVIIGQGEVAFRQFVDTLHQGGAMSDVPSLAYMENDTIQKNLRAPFAPVDNMPRYPYDKIDITPYLGKSYLGNRVASHNSSWGCPFACNFCAIVPLAKRRWLAESADRVVDIMHYWKKHYNIDGMEFHDMDFFVREDRTAAFSEGITGLDINWWGLGRVDTLMSYSDDTYEKMSKSGLKMVFMGAESGDDETLKRMNKGGNSGVDQTVAIVERMKHYGIVPELSFVLGNPPDPLHDIDKSIQFIRKLKKINPATEIVLYVYTPTPQEGSLLLDEAVKLGFAFPETLEEWASEEWMNRSMRRNPGTPWFKDPIRRRVRDFEAVVNAYYPTITDMQLQGSMRRLVKMVGSVRYHTQLYTYPVELKVLQRLLHYRRPETMGF